jgi:hypothetical protein
LLDEIIRMRRRVLRDAGPQGGAQDEARTKAEELIRGVVGWAFIDTFTAIGVDNYRRMSLEGRRFIAADVIARQPLLPDPKR